MGNFLGGNFPGGNFPDTRRKDVKENVKKKISERFLELICFIFLFELQE